MADASLPVPNSKIKPLSGRFGRLEVLRFAGVKGSDARWLCRCDCGTEKEISGASLRAGRILSCGCLRGEAMSGRNVKQLTGTFGRLRVMQLAFVRAGHAYWRCVCECGCGIDVSSSNLQSGNTQSCGCLYEERINPHRLLPEYEIWRSMVRRCHEPNYAQYPGYGGRGIAVCQQWRDSFEAFLLDMGRRPSSAHTLERKKNDQGYSPDNCIWATRLAQANNRRSNRIIEHAGRSQTLAQWAAEAGLEPTTLSRRLKRGWEMSVALTEPAVR